MPTIYDIAKACSLSAATVSYVLNGQGDQKKISKKTQERVLEKAKELNFRANLSAKRLNESTQSRYAIALLWPTETLVLEQPVYINSINNAISASGLPVDIILRPFTPDYLVEEKMLFSRAYYDAALLVSPSTKDLEELTERRPTIPIVLINRQSDVFSCVNVDNIESGNLAAELAVQVGGDSVLGLFGVHTFRSSGASTRTHTFIEHCEGKGVSIKDNAYYLHNTIEDGFRTMNDIIAKNRLKKLVYSSYDSMTLGALSALYAHGIRVGKDVYLISACVGLPELLEYSVPPVTVVDLQISNVAVRALHVAMSLLSATDQGAKRIVYHPRVVYRESCPMGLQS